MKPSATPRRPRAVSPGDAPLSGAERAELQRQGAKAAARGEPAAANPLHESRNRPPATGESQGTWSQRSEAWEQGHCAQSAARRDPAVTGRGKRGTKPR